MKRMVFFIAGFLSLFMCLGALVSTARAQTRDKYLISAKAGGINFVTGNVTVVRKGSNGYQAVTDQDNLESGDVVTTGMGGRVEVLLNPGSYLRIAENSEFELADTSLESLRVKLIRGSALIEVVGTDNTQLSLEVETPQTKTLVVKRGIYRFNILQAGATEVLVQKGRALVGMPPQEVRSGKMIVVGRGFTAQVVKIDKRMKDSLELWSRERAEYLASINRRISPSAVLADYSMDSIFSTTTYRNRYAGTWVYDEERRCYVFLPGGGGSSSPYGFGYRNWGRCCDGGRGNTPNGPPVAGGGNTPGNPNPPGNPSPPQGDPPNNPGPSEPRGGDRPIDSPGPVSRPEPAPVQVSAPAPTYTPPPSAPIEAPRTEAPVNRQNPQ